MKKILLLFISCASFGQYTPIAEKMAETIMLTYPDSMVVMKYNSIVEAGEPIIESNRPAKWNYEMGVVFQGFEKLWHTTGSFEYYQYMKKILDHFVTEDGKIKTYKMEDYNLDNIPTGRQLLMIYQTQNIKKYKEAADKLFTQTEWQPRTKANGYWHKLVYPTQMWLDGLYMAQPFRNEYAHLTANYEIYDDIAEQFIIMEKKSKDPITGLLYHGWDESKLQKWANKNTGQSPNFWSRSIGWYFMALVDVLETFPEDHKDRLKLESILKRTAAAILKYQDSDSGTWYQVTDQGPRSGNYLESSGSAMFVYGLAKGIRLGLLPQSYKNNTLKGMAGLVSNFISQDASGRYHFNKAVGGAGLGGTPYRDGSYEYYIKEPTRADDLKSVGPFLQACVEVDLLKEMPEKRKTVLLDNYFNNEFKNGQAFHYLWLDKFDSGYSWLAEVIRNKGAKTRVLKDEPSLLNLKKADVYIITDPDSKKETVKPNFINKSHINTLKNWVIAGGTLVLLANDTANCETKNFSKLTEAFGVKLSGKSVNMVKNDKFEDGKIELKGNHEIFKDVKKIFIKELVTLETRLPAQSILEKDSEQIMAVANIGKGKVFVLGDPWLYNEYVNGRKLPAEYENLKAAKCLVNWMLK